MAKEILLGLVFLIVVAVGPDIDDILEQTILDAKLEKVLCKGFKTNGKEGLEQTFLHELLIEGFWS